MSLLDRHVEPHPSGCGYYLRPPVGVEYQIFRSDVRTGIDGVTPGLIAKGYADRYTRYLDWDVPVNKSVTYRFVYGSKDLSYTVEADPVDTYSALEDSEVMDAPNPRDGLVVYYSTRLAQLVKKGKVLVHLKGEQTESNHSRKYSVRTEYAFEEAELPAIALDYSGGEATGLDLGHSMTEVPFKVDAHMIASSREERDSLRQAVVGLWRDTEWFLEDLGCYESVLTNLDNGMQADEPPFFTLSWSITGTAAVSQGHLDRPWEMLRRTYWQ